MAHFIANRSPTRVMLLVGGIIALSAILAFFDFTSLLSDDGISGRGSSRIRSLEGLLMVASWIGWLGMIVGVCCIPMIFKKNVVVEVTQVGIFYPPALKERLPWDRIERVAVRRLNIFKVLAIDLKDAENFPIKPLARKVAQMNKSTGHFGDVNIDLGKTTADFDALVAAVEQYVTVER